MLLLGTSLWSSALLLAPFAVTHEAPARSSTALVRTAGATVYRLGAAICHQRADRSFAFAGVQTPVCARCTGLHLSGFVGVLAAVVARRRLVSASGWLPLRPLLIGAAIPTATTLALEWFGVAPVGNVLRAAAAVPFGAVVGALVAAVAGGYLR